MGCCGCWLLFFPNSSLSIMWQGPQWPIFLEICWDVVVFSTYAVKAEHIVGDISNLPGPCHDYVSVILQKEISSNTFAAQEKFRMIWAQAFTSSPCWFVENCWLLVLGVVSRNPQVSAIWWDPMSWRPWQCPVLLSFQWIFTISSNLYVTWAIKKRWEWGKLMDLWIFRVFFFKGNREKHLHCSKEFPNRKYVGKSWTGVCNEQPPPLIFQKKTRLLEVLETPLLVYLVSFCALTLRRSNYVVMGLSWHILGIDLPQPKNGFNANPIFSRKPKFCFIFGQVVKIWQF